MRSRNATIRADLADKQAQMRAVLDPMRDYLTGAMIRTAEEWIANMNGNGDDVPVVSDAPPNGWHTPGGPDEGDTAAFDDVTAELDRRRVAAIMHDWQADNPDWWE